MRWTIIYLIDNKYGSLVTHGPNDLDAMYSVALHTLQLNLTATAIEEFADLKTIKEDAIVALIKGNHEVMFNNMY
tara:strand:- start:587 stop:811 length:225 start_codon:yes stop_codon:yes gene_type:complete